jgi:hypothetical protein
VAAFEALSLIMRIAIGRGDGSKLQPGMGSVGVYFDDAESIYAGLSFHLFFIFNIETTRADKKEREEKSALGRQACSSAP